MSVDRYSIARLREMLASDPQPEKTLGIPRIRVEAYVQNPRATEGDLALIVGREEGRVVASLGVIPDTLWTPDGPQRFGWFNHWNSEGGGVGGLLLLHAMRAYDDRVGVSGCTDVARRVYEASRRLVELTTRRGASFYVRSIAARAAARRGGTALTVPVGRCVDTVVNAAVSPRLARWVRTQRDRAGTSVRECDVASDEVDQLLVDCRGRRPFRRDATMLNWMLRYPFVGPTVRTQHFVEVRGARNRLEGFVFVQLEAGRMTVPYAVARPGAEQGVLAAIAHQLAELRADELLVFDEVIAAGLRQHALPIIFEVPREKGYLIGKRHQALATESLELDDGDGDAFV